MRDAAGFRMGPFELMDLTAIDVTHPATDLIYQQFYHEARYRPSTLMNTRMEAGFLGRKTGEGFYVYEGGKQQAPEEKKAPNYDGRAVWVSQVHVHAYEQIIGILNKLNATIDEGEEPDNNSLCIVSPLGIDATTAAIAWIMGLNAVGSTPVSTNESSDGGLPFPPISKMVCGVMNHPRFAIMAARLAMCTGVVSSSPSPIEML